MWMSFRKLELIPGFHFYITEINSKHQSSFLLSLEVELMLLLAILNRLKSFRWYFVMFAINWIYWKVELLQHVNMKHNNKFYSWISRSLYYISTQPFPTTCKHHYILIILGNEKFVAYTPCFKCHVHNRLTGFRRVYVGIGSLVCIINLLIPPVGDVLMRFSKVPWVV